uniref:Major facilitator superfamily (MFS) profile domain-containing protein n=1 Tax=Cuerna arida TaxID=1464854 RepID=A0A1B6GDL4_9HEMI
MTNSKEPQYSTVGDGCNNANGKPPRRIHLYTSVVILNIVYVVCGAIYAWSSPVLMKLKLSDSDASTIASSLSLGAMAGPVISGALLDKLGRKGTVALSMGFMTSSCLLLTATRDVILLSVGRFMSGVSWGVTVSSIPIYIAEISEDSVRGVLNTVMIISIATGSLFMYAIGPFISYAVLHYILVGICVFFFLLFPLLPNSPYVLVINNQTIRARDTLSWLRENRSPSYIENELQTIQKYISENQTNSASLMDLFTCKGNRRALMISCSLTILQQLSGITVVLFYMQNIFEMTGADLSSSTCSLVIGLVKFAAGFVCPFTVKSYGYKKPLTISMCGSALGMGGLAVYFWLKFNNFNVDSLSWLPLLSLIIYVFFFISGFGPIPWAISGELFPSNVKPIATMITTIGNAFFGFMTTKLFPYLNALIGQEYLFLACTLCCCFSIGFTILVVQDTTGMSFVEIQEMLNGKKKKDILLKQTK